MDEYNKMINDDAQVRLAEIELAKEKVRTRARFLDNLMGDGFVTCVYCLLAAIATAFVTVSLMGSGKGSYKKEVKADLILSNFCDKAIEEAREKAKP